MMMSQQTVQPITDIYLGLNSAISPANDVVHAKRRLADKQYDW